ncbi:uncharacterized protein [Diadema antillarum]|uniref:uncharacterized protein n=1 Tax=Diadema antillarum TaxID=105358 RepID=UPI003A85D691
MALTDHKSMHGAWLPLVSFFLTLQISTGFVVNRTWLESCEIGSSASLRYSVRRDIEVEDDGTKCSLESGFFNCTTPTGACRHNSRIQLVLSKKTNDMSWNCDIKITDVQEEDVGEYFLCQLDHSIDPPRCNNVHKTYLEAWDINEHNETCNITYDRVTRNSSKTCPLPATGGTTPESVSESSSSRVASTKGMYEEEIHPTKELVSNQADKQQGQIELTKIIPSVLVPVILVIVMVFVIRRTCWRRERSYALPADYGNSTP